MKKRIFISLFVLSFLFSSWFLIYKVDWISIFQVENISARSENKIGDVLWDIYKKTDEEIEDPDVKQTIDSLTTYVCMQNNIDYNKLKIHIVKNKDVNAFALPAGHIVINSGLLQNSNNESEFIGVFSHELSHVELNHVMKKMYKEFGISVLLSITVGQNSEMIKNILNSLTSTAYDRTLESEADLNAVKFMEKASIDPKYLAYFLIKISKSDQNLNLFKWFSTHPDSKFRAHQILKQKKFKKDQQNKIILNKNSWNKLKIKLNEM